jgi:RND superfamily putative drug exporter
MRKLAQWCYSHRRIVLATWLVIAIGITVIKGVAGSAFSDSFSLHGTQSTDAIALLQRVAPKASGDREQIVIGVSSGKVTDAAVRTRVEAALTRVAALPHVTSIVSPYDGAGAAQISRNGRIAFANVTFDVQAQTLTVPQSKTFVSVAQSGAGPGLQMDVDGQVAEAANKQGASGVLIGVIAALIVLVFVFGSLLAATLPLLTAGFALVTATSIIGLMSHVLSVASFSSQLSLLIGLGVGVDYALFIVTRYTQGLRRGQSPQEAIIDAVDTSGRAVMFAGITVCIALLGMFTLGVSFLYGVAIAAAIAVLCTVITALTLLPALIGFFGVRVLSRRQRKALDAGTVNTADASPGWAAWAARLQARPAVFAAVAAGVMLIVAIPILSMRLGSSDAGSDPSGTTTRKAYDLLAEGFGPGYNGPLQLVAQVSGSSEKAAFAKVTSVIATTPGVVRVTPTVVIPGQGGTEDVATANVYPTGSPQAESTTALLDHLRGDVIPAATAGSGVQVLVGGQTAIFADFSSVLSSKLPLFIGVVVLLSFLLLVAVFRSIVIPTMAAIMNLLSAVAAFGVITAVFQYGWGASLIGIDKTGPIEAFVPVLMFAILFGLSMDYEVFLVSRIYEEWHRSGDNRLAVTRGLAATGRTITAAAAIMVLVFAAFILGGQRIIELFGLGLASAVFLDAVIVRSIIVPGLMLVIGKSNWYLPSFLERVIPHLNVEGSAARETPGALGVPTPTEPALASNPG